MEQCVSGHYEASEARKVTLGENKETTEPKMVNENKESAISITIKVRGTTNQIFLQNHPRRKKSGRVE